MSDEAGQAQNNTPRWRYRWFGLKSFVRGNLFHAWARTGYRPTQRLLHRFNLHYAPPLPLYERGKIGRHHWCKWCGLCGDVITREDLRREQERRERAGEER